MSEKWLIINWLEISLVPFVIIGILALMSLVRYLANKFGLSPELQRKIIHVAVGISSLFFLLFFTSPIPVFILIACAIFVMLAMRRGKAKAQGIGSVLHAVSRPSYGEIYLALSVAFLFFRSDASPVLYVLPLLIITLSDTASALVGTAYGKMRFAVVEGTKSVEGVVAFFMVTWICSMIVLLLMSDTERLNVILLSFLIAAFCALVEADSWRGLDNLFVPIGAHLLLERHLGSDPVSLLLITLVFTGVVLLVIKYGKAFNIKSHAIRSYSVMLFLLLSVTHPINAVLPVIAILAHIVATKFNPDKSKTPDLDLLAAATGVGLIWLLAGETIELTVINLFNMTFAGLAVIFATLASRGAGLTKNRAYLLLPFSLCVIAICTAVAHQNPIISLWYDPAWPPITLTVIVSFVLAYFKSDWFSKWRCPKSFGIALIIPTTLFFANGVFQ